MTATKQFWALFKFQTAVNPYIWIAPMALCAPLFFRTIFLDSYHPNLNSVLSIQNLFLVFFFALCALTPEMIQGTSATRSSVTEFLLTRAIDRSILYRSRVAFLYVLVFTIPLVGLVYSLKNPDLKVTAYSKLAQQECLSNVPGSTLEPNPSGNRSPLISISRGNVLVEEWHFWMYAITALGAQVLLALLYPLKHRTVVFYATFIGLVFIPLIDLYQIRGEAPSHVEQLFFLFAAHQAAFWILTALALILGQSWCERRFCRLE